MKQRKKSFGMRISAFVLSFAMVCTLLAGVNVVAFAADGDQELTVSVSKFYNDSRKGGDGEHLFTKDEDEISWLSSLKTWNNEGEAWKAPVSSSEAVYRCYNPNSGEHLYVDEGYADYLAGMGWNKEKLAFYSDDNMGVPVYRLWNGQDGVGSHHFTTDAGEVDWLEGQGWIAEDVAFFGVKEEQSDVVQLVDKNGLQTDGTALKGDTLAIVFGSDFGVPASVAWYCNGSVVATANSDLDDTHGRLTYNTGREGTTVGSYYAQVQNTSGKVFKTNTIVVSEEGVPTLKDVAVNDYTDAYSDGTAANKKYQDFDTTDGKAVVTFNVNKIYADNVVGIVDAKTLTAEDPTIIQAYSIPQLAASGTQINAASKFTDKAALDSTNKVIYYKESNGSTTFKFVANNASDLNIAANWGLPGADEKDMTRGSSYVLGIVDTTENETVAISYPFEAPYLPAPKAVAITNCNTALGDIMANMTFYEDEEMTTPLAYLGDSNKANSMATITTICPGATVDMKATRNNAMTANTGMTVAIKPAKNGASEIYQAGVPVADIDQYVGVFGKAEFPAGIFAKDKIKLTADLVALPAESATAMGISYNAATAPNDLTVSFEGLKSDGTILVARTMNSETGAGVNILANTQKLLTDPTSAVGMATVTKGSAKVPIKDVVDDIYDDDRLAGDYYTAVFVPNDPTLFAVEMTVAPANAKSEMTGIDLDGETEFEVNTGTALQIHANSGATVVAIDQFGEDVNNYKVTLPVPVKATAHLVSEVLSKDQEVEVAVTNNEVEITATAGALKANNAMAGDYYTVKINPLQTLVLTCTDKDTAGNTTWSLSISYLN